MVGPVDFSGVPASVLTVYEGMRVTLWGWSLMLTSLVIRRVLDVRSKRHLHPEYVSIKTPEDPVLLSMAACFCVVVLSTYTRIVADTLQGLPRSAFTFPEVIASTTAFMIIAALFVTMLSYRRKFKIKWMFGWSVLSMLIVLAQAYGQ